MRLLNFIGSNHIMLIEISTCHRFTLRHHHAARLDIMLPPPSRQSFRGPRAEAPQGIFALFQDRAEPPSRIGALPLPMKAPTR